MMVPNSLMLWHVIFILTLGLFKCGICMEGNWFDTPKTTTGNNANAINCKDHPMKCLKGYSDAFSMKTHLPTKYKKNQNEHSICTKTDIFFCKICLKMLFPYRNPNTMLSRMDFNAIVQCVLELTYLEFNSTQKQPLHLNNNGNSEGIPNYMRFTLPDHQPSKSKISSDRLQLSKRGKHFQSRSFSGKSNFVNLCPNAMTRLACFENYMSIWIELHDKGAKRNKLPGKKRSVTNQQQLQSTQHGQTGHQNDYIQMLLNICPPGMHQVTCYDSIWSLLHDKQSRISPPDEIEESYDIPTLPEYNIDKQRVISMENSPRCRSLFGKLKCYFDDFGGYTTNPFKDESASMLSAVESNGMDGHNGEGEQYDSFVPHNTKGYYNYKPGNRRDQGNSVQIKPQNQKRVKGMCPESMDKVNCYDYFLESLLSMSNKNRGANEFIGRKAR